jgi:replicative superfamily II helicase
MRELSPSVPKDKDRLLPLIAETVNEGGSVLVFCGGRAQTQSGASMAAENMVLSGELKEGTSARREALVLQLQQEMGAFSNPLMENIIMKGEQ